MPSDRLLTLNFCRLCACVCVCVCQNGFDKKSPESDRCLTDIDFHVYISIVFRCLRTIHKVIQQNAELIVFFDMYDWLQPHRINMEQLTCVDSSGQRISESFQQCSIGIQTEVHPIPYAKDANYVWNVWDLRRTAVKLANIQKCRTKSTQTRPRCASFGTQANL